MFSHYNDNIALFVPENNGIIDKISEVSRYIIRTSAMIFGINSDAMPKPYANNIWFQMPNM